MRRHITYANIAATLALVLAMGGGALAAQHYLISSTKQISPKVLKKLRGATGKTGPQGLPGAAGKEGPAGKEGAPATKLLAAIKETGEATRAQGLVSSSRNGTGEYKLVWNRPIDSCYPVANVFGVTGYVVMAGISGAELDVETFAADGKAADTPFYVAVLC